MIKKVQFSIKIRIYKVDANKNKKCLEYEKLKNFKYLRYEAFVCVVKKIGSEAFLTFAGIGPYHVSENPETAIEEARLYFPDVSSADDGASDDDDKVEDLEENGDREATENTTEQVLTFSFPTDCINFLSTD